MEFEWDESKRLANLQKHGLDFLRGTGLFDGRPVYVYESRRSGEQRFVTVGLPNGEFVAIVWAKRNVSTRVISLRRARDGEKRAYRALYG